MWSTVEGMRASVEYSGRDDIHGDCCDSEGYCGERLA